MKRAKESQVEPRPFSVNIEPVHRRFVELVVQVGAGWEYGLDHKLPWKTPHAVRTAIDEIMEEKLVVYGWRTWAKLTDAQRRRGQRALVLGGTDDWQEKTERKHKEARAQHGGPEAHFMRFDAWEHTGKSWHYGLEFAEAVRIGSAGEIKGIVLAGGLALSEGALRMDRVDVLHLFVNRTREQRIDPAPNSGCPKFIAWQHTHRFPALHPLGWSSASKSRRLVQPTAYGMPDWYARTLVRDPQAPPLVVGTDYDEPLYSDHALLW